MKKRNLNAFAFSVLLLASCGTANKTEHSEETMNLDSAQNMQRAPVDNTQLNDTTQMPGIDTSMIRTDTIPH